MTVDENTGLYPTIEGVGGKGEDRGTENVELSSLLFPRLVTSEKRFDYGHVVIRDPRKGVRF